MSYVIAAPDAMVQAATELSGIRSALGEANAAAVPTTGMPAAGTDEVSAAVASLFREHAQTYQALSKRAAAFHQQFVKTLTGAGGTGGLLYGVPGTNG